MKEKNAIIIGGGVAELSAALAFQRVGWDTVVYEASDPPTPSKDHF